jgi:sRNA-binding protein
LRAQIALAPILEALQTKFPNCFSLDQKRQPLKIGIHIDIIARCADDDPALLLKAIAVYTNDFAAYQASLAFGAPRIDLDGNVAGYVKASEAEHAGIRLIDAGLAVEAAIIARSLQAAIAA